MSDFKAKMHKNRYFLPHWGSLSQLSPGTLAFTGFTAKWMEGEREED